MDNATKSKWQLRGVILLVFLLGGAAGALAPRAYHAWFDGGRQRSRQQLEQTLERLQLSPEQKAQVQQILGEAREQVHALRREAAPREKEIKRQTDERLRQVLTPEQFQQFQKAMEETYGKRRHGRGGRPGGPHDDRR